MSNHGKPAQIPRPYYMASEPSLFEWLLCDIEVTYKRSEGLCVAALFYILIPHRLLRSSSGKRLLFYGTWNSSLSLLIFSRSNFWKLLKHFFGLDCKKRFLELFILLAASVLDDILFKSLALNSFKLSPHSFADTYRVRMKLFSYCKEKWNPMQRGACDKSVFPGHGRIVCAAASPKTIFSLMIAISGWRPALKSVC